MIVYMEITQDELQLPLFVCDYISEMESKTGLTANNILSQISKGKNGKRKFPRFISVEIKEE